jgi:hypothetical protein
MHAHWYGLRRFANGMRGLYGLPVYLVGSALRPDNTSPRDIDIRIEMPDAEFEVRFGSVRRWLDEGAIGNWTQVRWRWSDECVKRSKQAWQEISGLVDFQVYPASYCRRLFAKKRKIRIDTRGARGRRIA